MIPPVPCAVTDTEPVTVVLVAVAVPPGVVLDPLAQAVAPLRPEPTPAVAAHEGGAVEPATTLRVSVAVPVSAGLSESATVTVKVLVVAVALGVPVMVPLGDRLSPAGSEPPVSVQVYGVTPFVAPSWVL